MRTIYTKGDWWGWTFGVVGILVLLLAAGWILFRAGNRNEVTNEQGATTTTPETVAPMEDAVDSYEYTSPKGVMLKVDRKFDNTLLASPVTITGSVPGNWSFEASFPVEIRDDAGKILAQEPATLQGDWMTTNYVPFMVTLNFVDPEERQAGVLILRRDNPSGLTENDDQVEIPIQLGAIK